MIGKAGTAAIWLRRLVRKHQRGGTVTQIVIIRVSLSSRLRIEDSVLAISAAGCSFSRKPPSNHRLGSSDKNDGVGATICIVGLRSLRKLFVIDLEASLALRI